MGAIPLGTPVTSDQGGVTSVPIPASLPADPIVLTDVAGISGSLTGTQQVTVPTTHGSTHAATGGDPVNHNTLLNGHNLTTDIDHDTIANGHNLTTDIDHDTLTNGHNLTTDIDHDLLTNFLASEHINHTSLTLTLTGSANEVSITNSGTPLHIGTNRAWTIGLADNPVIPGTEGVTLPLGTTAQRSGSPGAGDLRYNTTLSVIEYYDGVDWRSPIYSGGAFHDTFSDFVANEHIDWTNATVDLVTSGNITSVGTIYTNTIEKYGGGAGITIEDVIFKNANITFPASTSGIWWGNTMGIIDSGSYIAFVSNSSQFALMNHTVGLRIDLISEYRFGSGVIIEGVLIKDSNITLATGEYLYFNVGETSYIFDDGGDLTFYDATVGAEVTLSDLYTNLPSLGTEDQVPVMNAGGTNYDYSANLTFSSGTGYLSIGSGYEEFRIGATTSIRETDGYIQSQYQVYNTTANNTVQDLYYKAGGTGAAIVTAPTNARVYSAGYRVHDGTSFVTSGGFYFEVDGAIATADFDTKFYWELKEGAAASALMLTLGVNGLEYNADHSTDQAANDRWLPDKGYVDAAVAGGAGGVSKVGTPVDNEIGVWTGDGTLEGDSNFQWDGTNFTIGAVTAPYLNFSMSATPGMTIYSNNYVINSWRSWSNTAAVCVQTDYHRAGGTAASPAAAPTSALISDNNYYVNDGTTASLLSARMTVLVDGAIATADFDTKIVWELKEGAAVSADILTLGVNGLEYHADHATDQAANDRWIPDKAYVDAAVAAGGGGDVSKSGTPANDQVGVWTADGIIEGTANLTFISTTLDVNNTITVDVINEHTGFAGVTIEGVELKDSNVTLIATGRVYLDGGNNTYILESTGDTISFVAGGNTTLAMNATSIGIDGLLASANTDTDDLGAASYYWKDVYAQKYYIDDVSAYIDYDSGDLRFTDASNAQVTLSTLVGSVGAAIIGANPADNRVAIWSSATEIEGDANFTWTGAVLTVLDIEPFADSTSDIGSTTKAWANGYFDNIQSLDGSSGNGQPLTINAGDANGVGNDGGDLTIKAGNAVNADATSDYGNLILAPGNPYTSSSIGVINLGDSTYSSTFLALSLIGTQTNIGLQINTKGSGGLLLQASASGHVTIYTQTNITDGGLVLGGAGNDGSVEIGSPLTSNDGDDLDIRAGHGYSGGGNYAGGETSITGGTGYGTSNGGDVVITGGSAAGTGNVGNVSLNGIIIEPDGTISESVSYTTCTHSTTTNINIGVSSTDISFLIHYTASRNTGTVEQQEGNIEVLYESVSGTVYYTSDYIGSDLGFTITADLDSGNIRLNIIVDNSVANNLSFDYRIYSKFTT